MAAELRTYMAVYCRAETGGAWKIVFPAIAGLTASVAALPEASARAGDLLGAYLRLLRQKGTPLPLEDIGTAPDLGGVETAWEELTVDLETGAVRNVSGRMTGVTTSTCTSVIREGRPIVVAAPDRNRRTVRRYVAAFNHGDLEELRTLFTGDARIHGAAHESGIEAALPVWRTLHESLAIHLEEQAIVADADVVAARYTERGKSIGDHRGAPPTGGTYEVVTMEWFVFQGERIHRVFSVRDWSAVYRQLGLAMPPWDINP